MSKGSPISGKTPQQALRATLAAQRRTAHDARTIDQQITLLDTRPGKSTRERTRLAHQLLQQET